MARTAQQILAERRATIMESAREKDPTAKSMLLFHVGQLDAELAALEATPIALRCPRCQQPTHASESNDDGVCAKCLGVAAILTDLITPSLDLVAARRVVLSAHLDIYGHAPGNEFDLDAAARAYAAT
jgi:hypothetical protein